MNTINKAKVYRCKQLMTTTDSCAKKFKSNVHSIKTQKINNELDQNKNT